MFDPVDPKQALPDMEEGILQYWKEEDIFKRSIKGREDAETFSFYDGPPFATGLPHYGHLLAGTIKDVIPRYQTMRGKKVDRRFGWDCHGLPVENLIEKEHNITDHSQIQEMGVAKFNELCCASVQRYTKEWREVVERMGRWVDMDWDYRTMDPEYMESIWWVFSQLYEKELIYEGHKPMHICPRCVTPLSNFEVTQAYQDVTDHSVTVKFRLVEEPKTSILAWTTTPWTLPGNLLLAINPKCKYVKIRFIEGFLGLEQQSQGKKLTVSSKDHYIVSEQYYEQLIQSSPAVQLQIAEVIEKMKVKDLVGRRYTPLFPYFADDSNYKDAFRVVAADFVATDEGTGVVHIAPGFGEDDYNLGKGEKLPVLQHVTMEGRFVDAVTDFAGEEVKPADDPSRTDKKMIAWLEKKGLLFVQEKYKHNYPHCWRCDAPLLNYATSSWFVAVEKIKEDLLNANSKTEWVPAHLRDGRFGKWLEGARDWAISRNRFWGTPIPIWRCEETGEVDVIQSRADLMQRVPERFTKITAIRHAESKGNLIPIYQGEEPGTDLTEQGKRQAEIAGKLMAGKSEIRNPKSETIPNFDIRASDLSVDVIYCSPLARTQQTAQIIAKQTDAEVIVDDRLREVCFGEYESKTVDFSDLSFVKARRAHKLETSAPESIYHFPGMETWSNVQERIRSFMDEVLPKHRGEHIMIVTHADPIQNIVHFFTGTDPLKLSHQPYPKLATPNTFYWDHQAQRQMDLHKHSIDDITWNDNKGKTYERIPEVFDCWFESGSMPYAQSHFPFEQDKFEIRNPKSETVSNFDIRASDLPSGFPADFIAEGMDQTRGWFYTLMVLSTALFNEPAFKHCVVNGIILAKDGKKMSKRLKNYPEPMELVDKYGADAVRFTLMRSPAVRGEDLRFSAKMVEEAMRNVLLPLWNAYSFFVTYANAAKFEPVETRCESSHPLDVWIHAEVQDLVNRMTEQLDSYDLAATCEELDETIDALTNWYIRLSRRRFAGKGSPESPDASQDSPIAGEEEEDRLHALHTLNDVLLTMSQLLAPFCPFLSDALYLNLVPEEHGSVHLTDWPQPRDLTKEEAQLLSKTRLMRRIVSLGHKVRSQKTIKVRQPLSKAIVAIPPTMKEACDLSENDLALIRQELNVKELAFADDPGELADVIVRVDTRAVGPRLGERVQEVIQAGKRGDFAKRDDGTILILEEEFTPEEAEIVYLGKEGLDVAADHGIVVSVDTTVDDELEREGLARDLIRTIQRLRKEAGLSFTDQIALNIEGTEGILKEYGELIAQETRAELKENKGEKQRIEIDGSEVVIQFVKR